MKASRRAVLQAGLGFSASAMLPLAAQAARRTTIVVIPKLVGIPWFQEVKIGVDHAQKDLPQARVIWQGPSVAQVEPQIELIDSLIATHPHVIALDANDPAAVVPVIKKAQAAGIHVMTWDADANEREIFVSIVDPDVFGAAFADEMVRQIGSSGDVAVITSDFGVTTQANWLIGIRKRIAAKYPGLNIVTVRPSSEDQQLAYQAAQDILKAYPKVKGIFAITTVALPGAAEAVQQAGLAGKIALVGNATPNIIRPFIKNGTVKSTVIFSPMNHGYLTVRTAYQLATGGVAIGTSFSAGYLGQYTPQTNGSSMQITLGPPEIFTAANIDSPQAQF